MAVYILHFDEPIAHAQHYTGFSDQVYERLRQHARPSTDVRIIQEFRARGIGFAVGKIWHDRGRRFERHLKKVSKNARHHCEICRHAKEGENNENV